jgi:hypothetical protein
MWFHHANAQFQRGMPKDIRVIRSHLPKEWVEDCCANCPGPPGAVKRH